MNLQVFERFKRTSISHHLYLALAPNAAFKTDSERTALWRALQGEVDSIRPLLGNLKKSPIIAWNTSSIMLSPIPNAELHRIIPW